MSSKFQKRRTCDSSMDVDDPKGKNTEFSAQQALDKMAAWLDGDGSETEVETDSDEGDDEHNVFVESDASDGSDPESEQDTNTKSMMSCYDDDNNDDEGNEVGARGRQVQTTNDETSSYISNNGLVWLSADPPRRKTRPCNIRHTKEGPCGKAKLVESEMDAFLCFIDHEILSTVIENTNKYGRKYMVSKGRDPSAWIPVDEVEMKAVIGVLYLLGVYRSKHESLRSLWSSGHSGRPVFNAAFSINRFEQILAFMRFDGHETCEIRKAKDKFAPFQSVWNAFIENCRKNYMVGAYVTIDEQLIPFRGRCSFRQYMPNKPDKSGMKLFLMCDVATAYTFNGLPYVGCEGNRQNIGLADSVVKKLVEPVHHSGINVTTDSWFTSAELAADLLCKKITLLGTIHQRKPEVPREFLPCKSRAVGSSLFGFCQKLAMVSYVPKKNKVTLLLSSMHDKEEVDQVSGKPMMIIDYNETKGAVDRVDQLCHNYSVQKRTKRWPLAYFYHCLNIASINAEVIFMAKFPGWEAKHPHRRRIFLKNLGLQLLKPWLERRVQVAKLPRATHDALKVCGVVREKPAEEKAVKKRRRCHICPSSHDRKTIDRCSVCREPCCCDHKNVTVVCDYCVD
ncbi:piggyBac transposable element-derived protein 4-like [Scleropages formosus]|uniref:piggyBac transposable element-derived protein 4-like n=1 Tax=Scleropages formosus TaxID=113540 RepID=UPI0010FACBF6|nr:piggyBac transposable element-derived protein 4-like [Scleropages formosus]